MEPTKKYIGVYVNLTKLGAGDWLKATLNILEEKYNTSFNFKDIKEKLSRDKITCIRFDADEKYCNTGEWAPGTDGSCYDGWKKNLPYLKLQTNPYLNGLI